MPRTDRAGAEAVIGRRHGFGDICKEGGGGSGGGERREGTGGGLSVATM